MPPPRRSTRRCAPCSRLGSRPRRTPFPRRRCPRAPRDHHLQPMGVRQVGQRLECRAAFQEDAPEPVLVAGGAGDHVAPLRCHRPRRLEPFVALRNGQERVRDTERRLGDDGGVPLVRLCVACEQLGSAMGGDSGQVGDRQAASLALDIASDPMLRGWSTTTSVPAPTWANSSSRSCSVLATGLLPGTSPCLVAWHAQWENFPTSIPETAGQVAASVGMALSFRSSVDRSAASRDTRITWPWRSLDGGARQFPISRRKQRRPRRQHPPGPRGAGAEGRPRAPDRQSLGTYVNRSPTV